MGPHLLIWEIWFQRCLMETGPERKSADYESHYATELGKQTIHEGANLIHSFACLEIRLLGERLEGCQQVQLLICFLPKSRASIDQAPGPIIANVPPNAASISDIQISLSPARTIQSSMAATSAPTKGVHRPAKMNKPKTDPVISGIIKPGAGVSNCTIALWIRAVPVTSR